MWLFVICKVHLILLGSVIDSCKCVISSSLCCYSFWILEKKKVEKCKRGNGLRGKI